MKSENVTNIVAWWVAIIYTVFAMVALNTQCTQQDILDNQAKIIARLTELDRDVP